MSIGGDSCGLRQSHDPQTKPWIREQHGTLLRNRNTSLCFTALLQAKCVIGATCYASTYLFCACAVVGVNRAILVTCRDRQIHRNLVASLNGSNFIILAKGQTYLARNERNSIKFELLLGCKRHLDKILQPHHIKYLNIILILSIILCTNMYSLA